MRALKDDRMLEARFPPSEPCACDVCRAYCARPGWWTVRQASQALAAGFGSRMMLELSPDMAFGVLAPAFRGCEGRIAANRFARCGCTFLSGDGCALHETPHLPLECAFCHHARPGQGQGCHAALEADWQGEEGRALVKRWAALHLRGPEWGDRR